LKHLRVLLDDTAELVAEIAERVAGATVVGRREDDALVFR
jgi:hypothetical protein